MKLGVCIPAVCTMEVLDQLMPKVNKFMQPICPDLFQAFVNDAIKQVPDEGEICKVYLTSNKHFMEDK